MWTGMKLACVLVEALQVRELRIERIYLEEGMLRGERRWL